MPATRMLAAVDLGSNSFRLMIARDDRSTQRPSLHMLESAKETVRLAGGLGDDAMLDEASRERALLALAGFGERLREFAPENVRAVGTSTLRVARNARAFVAQAEAALGFPIEIVSGFEEARLIYLGAAHCLPSDGTTRLVVDVGGGSTECIVGTDLCAQVLESAPIGCVVLSNRHFGEGRVGQREFDRAYREARTVFAAIAEPFAAHDWRYAVGTSGTTKALMQISREQWNAAQLDRRCLARIREALVMAGDVERLQLAGLRADRKPVLAGGLAVMMAAFDELGIDSMRYCGGALGQGMLQELLAGDEACDAAPGRSARPAQSDARPPHAAHSPRAAHSPHDARLPHATHSPHAARPPFAG